MRLAASVLGALVVVAPMIGCQYHGEPLNPMYVSNKDGRPDIEARQEEMVNNALLKDMALTDFHFVPHTTALNSLGRDRLDRYAELLQDHGGMLRLTSSVRDEHFKRSRIQTVRGYLASAGIDAGRIDVVPGLAAGDGLDSTEAISVKENAFKPDQTGLTDLLGSGSSGDFGIGQ